MWPQWLRSPTKVHSKSKSKSKSPPFIFRCSSLKDIDYVLNDDYDSPICRRQPSIFHRVRISTSVLRTWAHHRPSYSLPLPGADQRVVLYFTSLRVVRRTYEDCKAVRSILRGFRVPIDERDVSMDSGFLKELQGITGVKNLTLPRVFIGGRYIGGAEEVKELHECGELKGLIGRLPAVDSYGGCGCEACGGHGFVLCEECSGSHKVYLEKSGFRICSACNVNGLVRCPYCSFLIM